MIIIIINKNNVFSIFEFNEMSLLRQRFVLEV